MSPYQPKNVSFYKWLLRQGKRDEALKRKSSDVEDALGKIGL